VVVQENLRVQTVLFLDFLRFSGDNIHKRNNPAAVRKLKIGLDMGVGNPARSDDSDPNHCLFLLFMMKLYDMQKMHDPEQEVHACGPM
jgi:hypothetical protein